MQLMTKLASKVDGGEAENKFSGSDQSLDALIAAMEVALVRLRSTPTLRMYGRALTASECRASRKRLLPQRRRQQLLMMTTAGDSC